MTDRQTIRKIKEGDIQAFEFFFRKYYEELCRWAYQYLHDRDSSEEVVQDLFYLLWRDRSRLEIRSSVKSYLYRAVSNNSMMILRKKSRRTAIESDLATGEQGSPPQPAQELEVSEIREVISKTMQELPERAATVFRMSRYEGLKYREIAEKLSISIKTVEANMGRALEMFRKNLQEYM